MIILQGGYKMEDKFGYNEMKNVVDHDAMEEQKKQEQLK